MFAYKDNGELLPLRREVSGGALMSPGRTDHGFRVARRGRRFGRVLLKPCVLMWWLLLAALSFLFIAVFGLKSWFPGHVVSGISTSQEVRIKFEILENVGSVVENVTSTSQESHIFGDEGNTSRRFNGGAEEEQGGSNVTRQAPRNSGKRRKQHFPCEVGFSNSVDHLIEPGDLRNFTQFSLEYIALEGDLVGTKLYESKFGGHQTLEGRKKSFYARNQTLHCGFVKGPPGSPSTGFDIDGKDKAFMSTCRIVVSSCIFGNSDFLRRPATQKMSEFSKKNVCFVMFVDEETLSAMPSDGHVPDASGYVGLWRIVVVRNLPFEDMRRTGKVPKFLQHRLFPSSLYSIWLDSKLRLNTDPMLILEYFLWRTGSEYAISNHYDRHCVWEEVLQNKRLNKYNHTAIDEQFKFYQSDGLTKFDPLDTDTPLPSYVPEGSFIVRAHTPMSNLFSCLWFNEVDRFTSRDQLSFAYTYLKLRRLNADKPFYLNMFKDCERRALTKLFRHKAVAHPPPHVID